jgi:hypothetical protein
MGERGDLIGVVEAAYAVDLDEFGWLRGIVERAAPFLDRGLGAFANTFEVDARMRITTRATAFAGIGDEHAVSVAQAGIAIPADQVAKFLRMSVSTMSEVWGAPPADHDHHRDVAEKLRAGDMLGIVALNPSGPGVVLGAPLPEPSPVDPTFRRRWGRVAAHIAAAARLRQRLGAMIEADTAELSRAALAVIRARGPLRHDDPDAALDAWPPLVAQRWTLIERPDASGNVRLVARENAPDVTNAPEAYAALGHPPDLVAYELGLD